MIAYQKEKMESTICFFAFKHKERTGRYLFQTSLYKYVALFEFKFLEKFGQPPIGLTYRAMERGPVPLEIYDKRDGYETECFSFRKDIEGRIKIIPKGKPDMDYFSMVEIEEMSRLVEIYADEFVNTSIMSDVSHSEIRAWRRTYAKEPNGIIDFKLNFSGDIENKSPEELTPAEENFLVLKGLEKATSE